MAGLLWPGQPSSHSKDRIMSEPTPRKHRVNNLDGLLDLSIDEACKIARRHSSGQGNNFHAYEAAQDFIRKLRAIKAKKTTTL